MFASISVNLFPLLMVVLILSHFRLDAYKTGPATPQNIRHHEHSRILKNLIAPALTASALSPFFIRIQKARAVSGAIKSSRHVHRIYNIVYVTFQF
jgi:hypothetical protein